MLGWLFGKKKNVKDSPVSAVTTEPDIVQIDALDEDAEAAWYDKKSALMETALGKEHDHVIHAILSYEVGGALHGYLYPNGVKGTGLATKQLARLGNQGASNGLYDIYEFVMFTRNDLTVEAYEITDNQDDPHYRMRSALNAIAPYSEEAVLNPFETLGFPDDWEDMAGRNFIFHGYKSELFTQAFGVMLIMEIFESELRYKEKNSGDALIAKLMEAGAYPYSDMDRQPVA